METDWKAVGRGLRGARYARGLSRIQVASAVGINAATVGAIERGSGGRTTVATLNAIAREVGYDPDDGPWRVAAALSLVATEGKTDGPR